MKIKDLTNYLEEIAPLSYQESYDNAGLIVGDPNQEIKSALISLDCTEEIVDEAISNNIDIIISHHPIVFKGLKKLNGKNYVERVIIKAIKNNIALYAIHTNLDHVDVGVNKKICDKLNLINTRTLQAKGDLLKKLVTYLPVSHLNSLKEELFKIGVGKIGNYEDCSFESNGKGSFKPVLEANPFKGELNIRHEENEVKLEILITSDKERLAINTLLKFHPYEEPAYDIIPLSNTFNQVGAGMIGELETPISDEDFLKSIKSNMDVAVIRHTSLLNKQVKKVAVCGGAGSFLLQDAIRAGADVFVSADFKYHEFFDADKKIIVADIGHFESEQFTQELLLEIIRKKFPNFALRLTVQNTNPIKYLS